jgi:hypothetical protein
MKLINYFHFNYWVDFDTEMLRLPAYEATII